MRRTLKIVIIAGICLSVIGGLALYVDSRLSQIEKNETAQERAQESPEDIARESLEVLSGKSESEESHSESEEDSSDSQSSTQKKLIGSVNFEVPEFAKFKGSENAEINLVEFGDYQCPFCKKFFDQTEPQMIQEYVNSGNTRFYFLDVSLLGSDSLILGQGSWCADEQGKYWEYHDYMYTNQGEENSGWGTPEKVKLLAGNISGLDVDEFSQCLDSKKYESRSQDLTEFAQQIGLTGTPTMFVGNSESGYTKIAGAQPYPVFQQVIETYLE